MMTLNCIFNLWLIEIAQDWICIQLAFSDCLGFLSLLCVHPISNSLSLGQYAGTYNPLSIYSHLYLRSQGILSHLDSRLHRNLLIGKGHVAASRTRCCLCNVPCQNGSLWILARILLTLCIFRFLWWLRCSQEFQIQIRWLSFLFS